MALSKIHHFVLEILLGQVLDGLLLGSWQARLGSRQTLSKACHDLDHTATVGNQCQSLEEKLAVHSILLKLPYG